MCTSREETLTLGSQVHFLKIYELHKIAPAKIPTLQYHNTFAVAIYNVNIPGMEKIYTSGDIAQRCTFLNDFNSISG